MRTVEEDRIMDMFNSAKIFVNEFDDIVSKIKDEKIDSYRRRLKTMRN